jgi:hypothetical protein
MNSDCNFSPQPHKDNSESKIGPEKLSAKKPLENLKNAVISIFNKPADISWSPWLPPNQIVPISNEAPIALSTAKILSSNLNHTADQLMDFFEKNANFEEEGIFRIFSDNKELIDQLQSHLINNPSSNLKQFKKSNTHDLANALKQIFKKINLFKDIQKTYESLAANLPQKIGDIDEENILKLRSLLALLPEVSRNNLKKLINILGQVVDHSDVNKMTTENLAISISNSIYEPKMDTNKPEASIKKRNENIKMIANLIAHRDKIF